MSLLSLISSTLGRWRYMTAAPRKFLASLKYVLLLLPNTTSCILCTNGVILQTKSLIQLVSSPCCWISSSMSCRIDSFLAFAIKSCNVLEFLFKIQPVGSSFLYGLLGRIGPARKVDIWKIQSRNYIYCFYLSIIWLANMHTVCHR